jgi:filamentous hemagglutinin
MTIRGLGGTVGTSGLGLLNQGTIWAQTNGATIEVSASSSGANDTMGLIKATGGGRLTLSGAWTNNGTIDLIGGTLTLNGSGGTWTNAATITTSGSTLTTQGTWANSGTIDALTSVVNLGGTFTQSTWGDLTVTGGPVNLTGTLQNVGQTFDITHFGADVPVRLASGSTIQGGTVVGGGSAGLVVNSSASCTLSSGVQMDADMTLEVAAIVTVTGDLTLNGSAMVQSCSTQTSRSTW